MNTKYIMINPLGAIILAATIILIATPSFSAVLLQQIALLWSFIVEREGIEKILMLCILGFILFLLNRNRIETKIREWCLRDVLDKMKSNKVEAKGWLAYKTNGHPHRQNGVRIEVINPAGQEITKERFEVIEITEPEISQMAQITSINNRREMFTADLPAPMSIGTQAGTQRTQSEPQDFTD
ncbi:MAG: hypothetical protein QME51_05915 [Planctomycetota bacterium]|nr:hypothetical protein [Planctomycetota bacterium]MDI6787888.1 hypothetical protein [Planctomycetota bacterium]